MHLYSNTHPSYGPDRVVFYGHAWAHTHNLDLIMNIWIWGFLTDRKAVIITTSLSPLITTFSFLLKMGRTKMLKDCLSWVKVILKQASELRCELRWHRCLVKEIEISRCHQGLWVHVKENVFYLTPVPRYLRFPLSCQWYNLNLKIRPPWYLICFMLLH